LSFAAIQLRLRAISQGRRPRRRHLASNVSCGDGDASTTVT
jgi:hypothetical protein